MQLLKRKIDGFLAQWKQNPERKPLIVKGARQIGKTESIRAFGKKNYESVIEINFVLQKKFRTIFDRGYEVDAIIKNISLLEPSWKFIPNKTLIFFDELQKCPDCATSLKSFNEDRRYDVICSGSLMGIYYEEIESNAVGNKEDFEMHSMDFEEFLWARGFAESQVEDLYTHMASLTPFSELELSTYMDVFRDYMTIGGMPEVVKMYIDNGHFGGTLELLRQLLLQKTPAKLTNPRSWLYTTISRPSWLRPVKSTRSPRLPEGQGTANTSAPWNGLKRQVLSIYAIV